MVPGHELAEASDFVVGDAGEDVGEPGLGIDTVELGGFDQGIGDGGRLSAPFGTHEQVVFVPEGDGPHDAFGGVVVELQNAVVEIAAQPLHPRDGVADGAGERGFGGYASELDLQPGPKIVKIRLGLVLAHCLSPVGRSTPGLRLDPVKRCDSFQRFVGDGRALRGMNVEELPADMGHAGDLVNLAAPVQLFEPSIAVGVHPVGEVGQMVFGLFSLAIRGEAVERRWWRPAQGRSSRTEVHSLAVLSLPGA